MRPQFREFWEAGFYVFGLLAILPGGKCACEDPKCPAVGKHPWSGSWQHTQHWSEDQLETMEEMGQFQTGFGINLKGRHLVIDVDKRNGGLASWSRLIEDIPEVGSAGLIVQTGSGDGSAHYYFTLPQPAPALVGKLNDYPGIDFKSTGYVVGPGSLHKSRKYYTTVHGSPDEIFEAPPALLEALAKPERHRAEYDGRHVDVSHDELAEMVNAIPNNDADYETWIRIGMGLHHASQGTAYDLWEAWSARSGKHDPAKMLQKWHSFGKSANPVTLGTLVHYAQEAGWVEPVSFKPDAEFKLPATVERGPLDVTDIDLKRPPGFVGRLVEYINSKQYYPRETLAVGAALSIVSSVAGMRYADDHDGMPPNMFIFGVSASATGKEGVLKSATELMAAAGIGRAVHGNMKSEQEIYRNLVRHQAAVYLIDELGETLMKIQGARKRSGSTPYLEGIIGALLQLYSKANSTALVTGDLRVEIEKSLIAELNVVNRKIEQGDESERDLIAKAQIEEQLSTIDAGLKNPYLSMFGLTTPERFNEMLDFDMASNGFLGRSLIFRELEDNPRVRKRGSIYRGDVPDDIRETLWNLYAPGYSEAPQRVARIGDIVNISTTRDAAALLDVAQEELWMMAEHAKETTGLTAIPRRGYEQVGKVSMTLAIPEGLRTATHVRWAYALVKRDLNEKIMLAHSNTTNDKLDALASLIMSHVTREHGETLGRIRSKCRKYRKEDVDLAVEKLKEAGHLREEEKPFAKGRVTTCYFAT